MADFEIGIQTAIQTCLPGVEIRGCRFHFGQAVWRKAMKDFGKTLKSSKCFADLVRQCLGLPYILTDELQDVVDQLKNIEMENMNLNLMRDKFICYIQNTWRSGIYSPDSWSCFGRKSDSTNNAQEAYNSVLNRIIKVIHPNMWVLIEHLVFELNYTVHNEDLNESPVKRLRTHNGGCK